MLPKLFALNSYWQTAFFREDEIYILIKLKSSFVMIMIHLNYYLLRLGCERNSFT